MLLRLLKFLVGIYAFVGMSLFAAADLSISEADLRFDPAEAIRGKTVKIYLVVRNSSDQDLKGVVKFFDEAEGKPIGQDQPIAVIAQSTDTVFLEFTPITVGEHRIVARILPWEETSDIPENNKIGKILKVNEDTDGDGIGNAKDPDDDNDGVLDPDDTFIHDPKEWADTDGDGSGNNADNDDDSDGAPDLSDAFPLDSQETQDFDQDGIGDNSDTDDDGDSIADDAEGLKGTDPRKFDSDGDGVGDGDDDFPLDSTRTYDTDRDGTPDEDDADDDGDGTLDSQDAFPRDGSETKDVDSDGVGDNTDRDDDNDGFFDEEELLAGTNELNADTDHDGFADGEDELPLDPTEHKDSDHDGLGDAADPNDGNSGPIIRVTSSTELAEKGEQVFFDATNSYDPDGGPLFFEWKFPDGTLKNGSQVSYIFHSSAVRTILLTVTDSAGETRTKGIDINVQRGKWEHYLWIFILLAFIAVYVNTSPKKKAE